MAQGEVALLLNYTHLPVDTPYRASHAIFVRDGAERQFRALNEVPDVLRCRNLSVRAFDEEGTMLDADLADGPGLVRLVPRLLAQPAVATLHAHHAKRGCHTGRIAPA